MLKTASALLVAGFCIAGVASAQVQRVDRIDVANTVNREAFRGDTSDEHWRDGDGVGEHDKNEITGRTYAAETGQVLGAPVVTREAQRVEARTEIQEPQQVAQSDVQVRNDGDRADRSGPVPFADIGHVGDGDKQLATEKAIEQDKQLLVRGEIEGDDLVIQLPAGTKHDTLSLRSDNGLNLSRADVARLGRYDGDCLKIRLSDIGRTRDDIGNLWVWGTGPESASLLQRVAMTGVSDTVASNDSDIPQRRSAGVGSTLGAPINEPNMMSRDEVRSDDQIEKEKEMMRDSGLEKSAEEHERTW